MTGFFQSIITIVLFILILGGLVVIHELGHFVTARLAKVRVLEFGIGFPPRAKVLRSKGETLYTLNWLPIGGFVKLEGEDGNDADDPRSFAAPALPHQDAHPRRRRRDERRSSRSPSSPASPGWRSPFVGVEFFEVAARLAGGGRRSPGRATRSSPSTASTTSSSPDRNALDAICATGPARRSS